MSKTMFGILVVCMMVVFMGCANADQKILTTKEALKAFPESKTLNLMVVRQEKFVDPTTGKEAIKILYWNVIPTANGEFVLVPRKFETVNLGQLIALNAQYRLLIYQEPILQQPSQVPAPQATPAPIPSDSSPQVTPATTP